MNKYERTKDYSKNGFPSEVNKKTGEINDYEEMEIKGKIQSTGSDFKMKRNISDRIENDIENVVERYNKRISKNI